MKHSFILTLIGLEGFLGLVLWLYFNKFPIFPDAQSGDFIQYVRIVGSYETGHFGGLAQNLLYGGVLFYLTAFGLVFHSVPRIVLEREAMAVLVLASPVIVFLSVKAMVESENVGLVFAALWTLCGYVWFGMVFNSGLYANFVGVLVSLALAGATVWATRGDFSLRKVGVYALVLLTSLFSHYSTLLLFPALIAYLAYVAFKDEKRRLSTKVSLGILLAPMVAGFVLYGGLLETMLGFLTANGGGAPSTDGFSQALLAVPVIGYMTAEVTFDIGAVVLFGLAILAVFLVLRSRNEKMLIPVVWFLTILIASPMNASAWRFAFVGLVPLTILAAYPVAQLLQNKGVRRGMKFREMPQGRRVFVVPILFLVCSGGWVFRPVVPFGALGGAVTDQGVIASSQVQTMDAISWMKALPVGACGYQFTNPSMAPGRFRDPYEGYSWGALPCYFLDVTDWHFIYSEDLGGPVVEYNPVYSDAPELASFHALSEHEQYLIVTNVTSYQLASCQPTSLLDLTVDSQTSNSATVTIHLFGNATIANAVLYANGREEGSSAMVNNTATATLNFKEPGSYIIQAQVGEVKSNTETVLMGLSPPDPAIRSEASTTSCWPINWTSTDLSGAYLAYSSPDVHIWKLTS